MRAAASSIRLLGSPSRSCWVIASLVGFVDVTLVRDRDRIDHEEPHVLNNVRGQFLVADGRPIDVESEALTLQTAPRWRR